MSEPEPTTRGKISFRTLFLCFLLLVVLGIGGMVLYVTTDPSPIRLAKEFGADYRLHELDDDSSLVVKFFNWCGIMPARLQHLAYVSVDENSFDDEALQILCRDPEINELIIENSQVTHRGLAACANLQNLIMLGYSTVELDNAKLRELRRLHGQSMILQAEKPVTLETAQLINQLKFSFLELTFEEIEPEAVRELATCPIPSLRLQSDHLTNEDAGILFQGKFRYLGLFSVLVDERVEQYLNDSIQIEWIYLFGCSISPEDRHRLWRTYECLRPRGAIVTEKTDEETQEQPSADSVPETAEINETHE